MKEELERLLMEATIKERTAFAQSDNTAKHFYAGQVNAYKLVLRLLSEEG